ncbi:GDSL-type esterase/lipase family protein [Flavobacteriales bacterium]|nr:GDSL-type esterase/lipase family protein [Flavobacteriales bacterium]
MINILCFGDSNTWGYDPANQTRFLKSIRWTGVLQNLLGDNFNIIEEGLNGRTTNVNEREEHSLGYYRAFRSSMDLVSVLIETNSPIDLVVIMLGTNDLKNNFNQSVNDISYNMRLVCETIINNDYFNSKSIILVSPTHINESSSSLLNSFIGTAEKSKSLAKPYKKIADDLDLFFVDASKSVKTNQIDGLHWDSMQHSDFANSICLKIKSIYS